MVDGRERGRGIQVLGRVFVVAAASWARALSVTKRDRLLSEDQFSDILHGDLFLLTHHDVTKAGQEKDSESQG